MSKRKKEDRKKLIFTLKDNKDNVICLRNMFSDIEDDTFIVDSLDEIVYMIINHLGVEPDFNKKTFTNEFIFTVIYNDKEYTKEFLLTRLLYIVDIKPVIKEIGKTLMMKHHYILNE